MKGYYKNDLLKIIAAVAMVVDHIGAVFFQELVVLRIIGRISFPIFAFYIAMGFSWTSNSKKYIIRVLGAAIVTQIPFSYFSYILFDHFYHMNVLFTFAFALLCLYFLKRKNYIATGVFLLFPQVIAAFTPIDFDYGSYGALMVIAFYLFKEDIFHRNLSILFLTIAHGFVLYIPRGFPFYTSLLSPQFYCVLALPLLDLKYKLKINLPKYFFYLFYPTHIAIIVMVYLIWFI